MLAKSGRPLRCQTSLRLILLVPLHPVLVLSCFSLLSSRHLCPFWPLLYDARFATGEIPTAPLKNLPDIVVTIQRQDNLRSKTVNVIKAVALSGRE